MDVRFDLRICQVKVIKDGPPADYFSRPEALQLKYALMSFPNNTVANSFIAGAFLTIYINARLKPFSRGDKQPNPFKVLLVMFPLMVALGLSSVPLGIHVSRYHGCHTGRLTDFNRNARLQRRAFRH